MAEKQPVKGKNEEEEAQQVLLQLSSTSSAILVDSSDEEHNIKDICGNALFNGWLKVWPLHKQKLQHDVEMIAKVCGWEKEDFERIRLCSKVALGTNGKRSDFKKLQSSRDTYLNQAVKLLRLMFKAIDKFEAFEPKKEFSVVEKFEKSLEASKAAYEAFSLKVFDSKFPAEDEE
jgi:hypothetical protein